MTHHPDHEVELYRDEGAYEVYVDLPGYDGADLDVHWHDGRLHVAAERRDEDGRMQVFDRNVSVPRRVDDVAISATYDDDVLHVRLPITDERAQPGTRIDVEE